MTTKKSTSIRYTFALNETWKWLSCKKSIVPSLFLMLSSCCIYMWFNGPRKLGPHFPRLQATQHFLNDHEPNNGTATGQDNNKIILFWVPFFSMSDYAFGFGRSPFVEAGCPINNCEVTNDRSRLESSSAVLFHLSNIIPDDLPPVRYYHQRWVFFTMESPDNTVLIKLNRHVTNLRPFDGHFNWTMTYRLDSDIVLSYFKLYSNVSSLQSGSPLPPPRKKRFLVAWVVSHCRTSGKREQYVRKLQDHISVDVFGDCGKPCPTSHQFLCKEHIFENYKFYLAFENSICADYVTEKLSNALVHDIVPVVYGGAKYERLAPPGSFIDVRNFSSPRHLAEYLRLLDGDDDLYNSYFAWKSRHKVSESEHVKTAFCHLCAKLNDDGEPGKVYERLHDWWIDQGNCSNQVLGYPGLQRSLQEAELEMQLGFLRGY